MANLKWLGVFAVGVALAISALTGCTSHIMIGEARPAISPDQVHVYIHPPEGRFEEIAVLDTSSRGSFSFTEQGKTDKVIERLKVEAAKMGANGVLLRSVGDKAEGTVGFGSATANGHSLFGLGIGMNMFTKSGNAVAIYVQPNL
jgi:hypothetical protein